MEDPSLGKRHRQVAGTRADHPPGPAVWTYKPASREFFLSAKARSALRFDRDVVSLKEFLDRVGQPDRAKVRRAFARLPNAQFGIDLGHSFRTPFGRVLKLRTSAQAVAGPHSDLCAGTSNILFDDHTGFEPPAEVAAALVDATSDAIILVDCAGIVHWFNPAAEDVFGYGCEEIRGKPLSWLIPASEREAHEQHVARFVGAPATGRVMGKRPEFHGLRKDGRAFPAEVSIARFRVAGQTLLAAVVRDVSLRRERERQLEAAKQDADLASEAKSRFLAHMSHELRTPLNGILGTAQVLDSLVADPTHRELLGTIRDSGETLLDILNTLLDLAKIESGQLSIADKAFVPEILARRLRNTFTLKAEEKGISFSVLTSIDIGEARIGDELRVLQILFNLVSNAIKFTESGAVEVLIRAKSDQELFIEVKDTGIGMTACDVERLFTEFEQADSSTTRRYGGTGLGLPIVKALVDLMNGSLSLQTEPDVGTTVKVTLPLPRALPATQPDVGQCRIPAAEIGRLHGLHVLVAEDSYTNQAVLGRMLTSLGVSYDLVEDGWTAVEHCKRNRYDLLLLDIHMPDMDGTTVLSLLRHGAFDEKGDAPPAVAISADAKRAGIDRLGELGFAAYLEKPLSLKALWRTLLSVLEPVAAAGQEEREAAVATGQSTIAR